MKDSKQSSTMDLNLKAIDEFRLLIESDKELSKDLKNKILHLIESGVPEDLHDLEEILLGVKNDLAERT